jgi:hypothetical protein
MFALLPYVVMLSMLGLVVATIVVAVMGRPKRAPKNSPMTVVQSEQEMMGDAEPVLDFGDELAQMEKK